MMTSYIHFYAISYHFKCCIYWFVCIALFAYFYLYSSFNFLLKDFFFLYYYSSMYVTSAVARKHYGVSNDTLRRWANAHKIDFIQTQGKHRRYFVPQHKPLSDIINIQSTKFVYARVSSNKQKSDLQHQIQFLSSRFPDHQVISDIGSGLNFRRKGLKTILDKVYRGDISEVVVASKDRLARFGYELIEDIFTRFNARIIILENDSKETKFEEELAEDVISVITFFTARYSGKRKYIKKEAKTIKENKSRGENEKSEDYTIKEKIKSSKTTSKTNKRKKIPVTKRPEPKRYARKTTTKTATKSTTKQLSMSRSKSTPKSVKSATKSTNNTIQKNNNNIIKVRKTTNDQ